MACIQCTMCVPVCTCIAHTCMYMYIVRRGSTLSLMLPCIHLYRALREELEAGQGKRPLTLNVLQHRLLAMYMCRTCYV